jgi:hypothetical protein
LSSINCQTSKVFSIKLNEHISKIGGYHLSKFVKLTIFSSGGWFDLRTALARLETRLTGFLAEQRVEEVGQDAL